MFAPIFIKNYTFPVINQSTLFPIHSQLNCELLKQVIDKRQKEAMQQPLSTPPIAVESKVDPITTVQDSIDGLSLSIFEALRGVRDSVAAPESSTVNANSNNDDNANLNESVLPLSSQTTNKKSPIDYEMDYEDFLLAYHRNDQVAFEFIKMAGDKPPKTSSEYLKSRASLATRRTSELMSKLAGDVLIKSAAVHRLVERLPNRPKSKQMDRIAELIEENRIADEELQNAYEKAQMRQKELRSVLGRVTCTSLGILEEK